MIKSMTGFGKALCELNKKNIVVEAKSLNSKQLDLNVKIPYIYKEKELEIRNLVTEKLSRGKIDVLIYFDNKDTANVKEINKTIVQEYYKQLKEISDQLNDTSSNILSIVMKLPDVMKAEMEELDEQEWVCVERSIQEAIAALNDFRNSEGQSLEKYLNERVRDILSYMSEIEKFEKERLVKVRQKMRQGIDEIIEKSKIDENRFEQELIYYIEKLDISEEKLRLTKHCEYFIETMQDGDNVGRKLNFIAQEMGREINTLGSKSNDADMQRFVVLMKDELEKIKEQVLNVL